jgi:hypothetical protein
MSIITHAVAGIKSTVKENVKYQPGKAFGNELKTGFKGSLLSIPFIAFEAGYAQRGELSGTLVGRSVGICTYPVLAGVMAAGLAMIPGVNVAVGLVASLAAMYPNGLLEESVIRKVNWLTKTGKSIRHLEIGGQYVDSDYAKHQRQIASMELSSATGATRRFLGNEALVFHR